MSYSKQTWIDGVSAANAVRLGHVEDGIEAAAAVADGVVTTLGTDPEGTAGSVAERLTAIEAAIGSGAGTPGTVGAEAMTFGPPLDTTAAVTGDIYGPFVAPVDYTILAPVVAALRGAAASGDTVFDMESCASGITGPWTSIFTSGLPTVLAGDRTGLSTVAPSTTALAAGGALRMKVLSAATGGGATTWRAPGSAGNGATATVNSFNIPIPTGTAAGDLMVAVLFLPSTATPGWPTGWTVYGTPFPAGTDATLGPFYMHVATKVASGSESTTQVVSFSFLSAVMSTVAVSAATLVAPTSSNILVNGSAGTSAVTPSLTTPAANCVLVHLAMPRWTSGNIPSTISWSGSLATDTQAQTNRTTAQNTGIAVAHETQATAGAVTARTAAWTNAARSLTATLVFQPSSGAAPTGPEVTVRLRPTS